MEHCRDCRFWQQTYLGGLSHGQPMQGEERARLCLLVSGRDESVPALFWGDADSGYQANVLTMADFGCVQWEERPA